MDFAHVVALLWRELGFKSEMRQADDRIHRGADFVAHVRQEHGLHLRGLFGLGLCLAQFLGNPFLVTDVHQQADQSARGAIRELESVHRVKGDVRPAIRVLNRQFITAAARGEDDRQVFLMKLAPFGLRQVIQFQHSLALERIAGRAEFPFVSLVAPDESALGVFDEHRVGNGCEQCTLKCQAVSQFLLGAPALGDVGAQGKRADLHPLFIQQGRRADLTGNQGAVRRAQRHLVGAGFPVGAPGHVLLEDPGVFLISKVKDAASHDLLTGSPENPAHRIVHLDRHRIVVN